MKPLNMTLKSPLFVDWSAQHVKLVLPGVVPGTALGLTVGGVVTPFQYTGVAAAAGAEVVVRLGFAAGEVKELAFAESASSSTDLSRVELPLGVGTLVGVPGRQLAVGPAAPFAGLAGFAMGSAIDCEAAFEGSSLARVNDGPLFIDYQLEYRFAESRRYTLDLRCYRHENGIEVAETFSLGMDARLRWTLNPERRFTHIISRESFEGENQPAVEPLGQERPRDVLCRLQMPVLTEYFIPNNRGWFAFYDERDEAAGMVGVLGLYGARWEEPVINMPELFDRGGTVEWQASLASGKRHWLLYVGEVEKGFRVQGSDGKVSGATGVDADPRLVFHRLHADFNAMRLDEHLDLTGDGCFDASCASLPGLFAAGDFHAVAQRRSQSISALRRFQEGQDDWMRANGNLHLAIFRGLVEPSSANHQAIYELLSRRFEKWVRQFQGYRTGENDYAKNVIGFSRCLRGLLIGYELLRRDGALDERQVGQLNAYFAFAARRILDEGRWPHAKTWKHPDHPESTRDFYTYGGEHKPDRLFWTNCLPNFQSDPMCALVHLSALFKDHPDAGFWRRFALDDIDGQLDAYCGASGAWEESINYALYTFSYFVITFKVVKERWGIDYFNDARVRRLAAWLCRFFGPFDKRFGGHTWPAIGNAVLPQNQAHYLFCYAAELAAEDPLRVDCLAVYRLVAEQVSLSEHYGTVMAAMAPMEAEVRGQRSEVRILGSEVMDEVGVAMRHRHPQADESYLFQKIGFAKDHYEGDESAFNWYAKGTPLCMDYGTYTGDIGVAGAHNLVEIPDEDNLRRGYLADHLLTPLVDYTRCELPVTLKLLWGRVRSFAEVENKDGKIDRSKTPYFYIGDKNPVGPKVWKVRQLLFVKPDYVAIFDRVYGRIPHRYNLHVTGSEIDRQGQMISATGRFDLDLLAYVQHPAEFDLETGEIIPKLRSADRSADEALKHAQHYFRLYNRQDGIYRTVLFARERGREVQLSACGRAGVKVVTADYTDYLFLHNDVVEEQAAGVRFVGRAGWIRRQVDGVVCASLPDGELIEAFGMRFEGRGPWTYNLDGRGEVALAGGPPRPVQVSRAN